MDKGKVLVPEHPVGAGHLWNGIHGRQLNTAISALWHGFAWAGAKFGRLHKGNGMFQKIRQPHPVFH